RHVGRGRCLGLRLRPGRRVPPHGIVAAVIAESAQLLEDPDVGQAFALRPARVLRQQFIKLVPPRSDLRLRLDPALIGELRRARPNDLPYRLPRNPQLAADLLDRLLVLEVRPTNLRNCLHHQHPEPGSRFSRKHDGPPVSGGPFWTPITPVRGPFCTPIHNELLNESLFFGLDHARSAIAEWRQDFNTARPHSSLGYQTPAAFAGTLAATGSNAS